MIDPCRTPVLSRAAQHQEPPSRRSRDGGARRPAAAPKSAPAPRRDRFGRGEPQPVGPRQRARRPQAPSGQWGAKPRAPAQSAATSGGLTQSVSRAQRARGRCVQHRGVAQDVGERSDPTAQPLPEVAALCAGAPPSRPQVDAGGRRPRRHVNADRRGVQPRHAWGIGASRRTKGPPGRVAGLACFKPTHQTLLRPWLRRALRSTSTMTRRSTR